MSTPNLDATGYHWVNALAKYDFRLEYQKGQDNATADALSSVTTHLPPEAVQAVLDRAAIGTSQCTEVENPAVIENNQCLEQEVRVAARRILVEMHVTNWARAQKEDPELDAVLQWLSSKKKVDLKTLLGEWCKEQRRPDGMEKLPELRVTPRHPLFTLHPKRRR